MALRTQIHANKKEKLPQNKIAPRQYHGAKLKINVFSHILQLHLQLHFILPFLSGVAEG